MSDTKKKGPTNWRTIKVLEAQAEYIEELVQDKKVVKYLGIYNLASAFRLAATWLMRVCEIIKEFDEDEEESSLTEVLREKFAGIF